VCFSLDASSTDRLGRYINDAPRAYANCAPKALPVDGRPRIIINAIKAIKAGTELRYDYGGSDLPWRKVSVKQDFSFICLKFCVSNCESLYSVV